MADTLGSVGVLVSCYLVTNYNIAIADPICAMVVSIMIFVSVLPLIKMSCEGLLLQTPDNIYKNYNEIRQKLYLIEGVKKIEVLFVLKKFSTNKNGTKSHHRSHSSGKTTYRKLYY